MYSKLFERGQIGSLTLKNRAVMTSMTTGYAGRKTGTVLLFLSPCSYMKQRDGNKRTVPCC